MLAFPNSFSSKKEAHLDSIAIPVYEPSTIDLGGLPSSDWTYLRKSGLLLANNKPLEADATLKMIKVQENERMEKIYKKLKKETKRAIKRSS